MADKDNLGHRTRSRISKNNNDHQKNLQANQDNGGHRERLRERFLKGGLKAVADYEILELMLFSVIPIKDVKPTAKALLRKFTTITGVFQAEEHELIQVNGIGRACAATIKTVFAVSQILLREKFEKKNTLTSFKEVVDYCKLTMSHLKIEQLRLLFLDSGHKLLSDEIQQQGTINHTPMYTREVIRRCLELGATGLIIIHNHPSGESQPSNADVQATYEIQKIGERLGIVVHDHIVIGHNNFTSFKNCGLISK